MTANYWAQHAELRRKHDDADPTPDAPINLPTVMIAAGTLGEMIDRWAAYADGERPRYTIHLGGGSLTDTTMEALRGHPRPDSGEGRGAA